MHTYATDTNFTFKNAITQDFEGVTGTVTGQDYQWFFDEWVYSPNHPVYSNICGIEELGGQHLEVDPGS